MMHDMSAHVPNDQNDSLMLEPPMDYEPTEPDDNMVNDDVDMDPSDPHPSLTRSEPALLNDTHTANGPPAVNVSDYANGSGEENMANSPPANLPVHNTAATRPLNAEKNLEHDGIRNTPNFVFGQPASSESGASTSGSSSSTWASLLNSMKTSLYTSTTSTPPMDFPTDDCRLFSDDDDTSRKKRRRGIDDQGTQDSSAFQKRVRQTQVPVEKTHRSGGGASTNAMFSFSVDATDPLNAAVFPPSVANPIFSAKTSNPAPAFSTNTNAAASTARSTGNASAPQSTPPQSSLGPQTQQHAAAPQHARSARNASAPHPTPSQSSSGPQSQQHAAAPPPAQSTGNASAPRSTHPQSSLGPQIQHHAAAPRATHSTGNASAPQSSLGPQSQQHAAAPATHSTEKASAPHSAPPQSLGPPSQQHAPPPALTTTSKASNHTNIPSASRGTDRHSGPIHSSPVQPSHNRDQPRATASQTTSKAKLASSIPSQPSENTSTQEVLRSVSTMQTQLREFQRSRDEASKENAKLQLQVQGLRDSMRTQMKSLQNALNEIDKMKESNNKDKALIEERNQSLLDARTWVQNQETQADEEKSARQRLEARVQKLETLTASQDESIGTVSKELEAVKISNDQLESRLRLPHRQRDTSGDAVMGDPEAQLPSAETTAGAVAPESTRGPPTSHQETQENQRNVAQGFSQATGSPFMTANHPIPQANHVYGHLFSTNTPHLQQASGSAPHGHGDQLPMNATYFQQAHPSSPQNHFSMDSLFPPRSNHLQSPHHSIPSPSQGAAAGNGVQYNPHATQPSYNAPNLAFTNQGQQGPSSSTSPSSAPSFQQRSDTRTYTTPGPAFQPEIRAPKVRSRDHEYRMKQHFGSLLEHPSNPIAEQPAPPIDLQNKHKHPPVDQQANHYNMAYAGSSTQRHPPPQTTHAGPSTQLHPPPQMAHAGPSLQPHPPSQGSAPIFPNVSSNPAQMMQEDTNNDSSSDSDDTSELLRTLLETMKKKKNKKKGKSVKH